MSPIRSQNRGLVLRNEVGKYRQNERRGERGGVYGSNRIAGFSIQCRFCDHGPKNEKGKLQNPHILACKIAKPAHLQNCRTRTFSHILGAKLQNPHIARTVVQNCKTRTFAQLQYPHIGTMQEFSGWVAEVWAGLRVLFLEPPLLLYTPFFWDLKCTCHAHGNICTHDLGGYFRT